MTFPTHILGSSLAGSYAHGLATEQSDFDTVHVFAFTREQLYGIDSSDNAFEVGDAKFFELGKVAGLALKSNPTILETLHLCALNSIFREELLDLFSAAVAAPDVASAYKGFVNSQITQLAKINWDQTNPRYRKLLRHGLRAAEQGKKFLLEAEFVVNSPNKHLFVPELSPMAALDALNWEVAELDRIGRSSDLELKPESDRNRVNQIVVSIRERLYD